MTNREQDRGSNFMATARAWLAREDSVAHEDRLERLTWMAERMNLEKYLLELGGLLGRSLFEKMRYCFVYGQFIAASLLGLAYIERSLAAYFYTAGRNDLERAPVNKLLSEARAKGLVSEDYRQQLDRIRQTRNAHAHFRRPGCDQGVEYRAFAEDESFYRVIEADATAVVEAALWISGRLSL